jgi:hypothetical protein
VKEVFVTKKKSTKLYLGCKYIFGKNNNWYVCVYIYDRKVPSRIRERLNHSWPLEVL